MHFRDEWQFLHNRQSQGQQTVLVTVCAVEGSSMRNPGTIVGVAEDGEFVGSLSGGCIESAVVAEAKDVLDKGVARVVRFGSGSPYLDIRLPCGGGLDLHFQPLGEASLAADCLQSIDERQPFSIVLDGNGARHVEGWQETRFDADAPNGIFGHWPAPRLLVIGHGAGVEALGRLSRTMGCKTSVLTPDERIVENLRREAFDASLLRRTTQTDLIESDLWTAIVFLFHDHDWEIDLMARALRLPHFFIGAMGGRRAHEFRSKALSDKGVGDAQIASIRAPIGLFHSSRDPQTLALSTLAQVIRTYQETDFSAAAG